MNSTEYKAKKKHFHNSCDKQYYNSKHFHHIQNNKKNHIAYFTCIQETKNKPTNFPVSNFKST